MNISTIKKNTLAKILGLSFSLVYGIFIIASVQKHFSLGSGDITSYVLFFDDFKTWTDFNSSYLEGGGIFNDLQQGAFRYIIFILRDLLSQSTIAVLSGFAFITSATIFCISTVNIRSRNYLYHLSPLIIMVFFTPRVMNLFSSGIRSGIAFTILIVAIVYLKGSKKYILFGLSCLMHLSMMPIICLYFLYCVLSNKRINLTFIPFLSIILFFAFFTAIAASKFYYSIGIAQSAFYQFLVLYLGLIVIFINKKVVDNIYGFLSVGFLLIVISGFMVNFSFIRYVGNAIILYLMFLVKNGEVRTIQTFTICYAPFFVLTLLYSITNHW